MKNNGTKTTLAFIIATMITFFIISETQLHCSNLCIVTFMFSGALLVWGILEFIKWLDERYGGRKENEKQTEDKS